MRYRPIQPIDRDAAERSMRDADRLVERWRRLREDFGEDRTRQAVEGERRRAAIETGVIERLYDVSRGVTEAIVRHGIEASETRTLRADVFDQIAAHENAEGVVVEAVAQDRPITTALLKELHSAVTAAQTHYPARDPDGRAVLRPLVRGDYKQEDNHVEWPDGTRLEYAPALQVASEMDNLVAMIDKAADHPVRVAAFAHHRFSQIHPFADGNGRVARLLASLLLLRGGALPLVIDRDLRDAYLAALREADGGTLLGLVDFFVVRQRETLDRIEARVFDPASAEDLTQLAHVLATQAASRRDALRAHRDLEAQVVEPVLGSVQRVLNEQLQSALDRFRDRGFDAAPTIHPRELREDAALEETVAREALAPAQRPRVGWLEAGFRIGDREERRTGLGVVALAPVDDLDGIDAAVVLHDLFHGPYRRVEAPLLTVSADALNERDVRRWVDEWLGRMLVDYAQRL